MSALPSILLAESGAALIRRTDWMGLTVNPSSRFPDQND